MLNINDITIRKFNKSDSVDELTELLHKGYKQLAEKGLKYVATDQTSDITRKRLSRAECYLAEKDNKIIGTIAYYPPDKARGCEWYELPTVAKFGQFCVLPEFQKHGIGSRMIELAESLAARDKAEEISLDTAEPAKELIEYYKKRGYRFIKYVQWGTTNYRSVILSKKLVNNNSQ